MSLRGNHFATTAAVAQLMRNGTERLRALPGVEVAGAACCVPLQGGFGLPVIVEGRPLDGPSHGGGGFAPISPGYFSAFKIPIVRGRALHRPRYRQCARRGDHQSDDGETAAGRTGDPLADRITIGRGTRAANGTGRPADCRHAGDVRDGGLNRDPQPIVYVPWAQMPDAHSANLLDIAPMSWIIRTRGEPYALSSAHSARAAPGQRRSAGGAPALHGGCRRTVDGPLRFQHVGAGDLRRCRRWSWRR